MKLFKKAKDTQPQQRNEPLFIKYVGDRLEQGLRSAYEINVNNVLLDRAVFDQLFSDISLLKSSEKSGKQALLELDSTKLQLNELQEEYNDLKAKFEAHFDEAKEHIETLEARVTEMETEVEERDKLLEGQSQEAEKDHETIAKLESVLFLLGFLIDRRMRN